MPTPAERAATLHERIHAVLIREFGREAAIDIAAALSYELVSMLAAHGTTRADADSLLDDIVADMRRQIRAFPVGRYHP